MRHRLRRILRRLGVPIGMTIGDLVVVLSDPLEWGVGMIGAVTETGRLRVTFTDDAGVLFDAHELELLSVFSAGEGPAVFTDADIKAVLG